MTVKPISPSDVAAKEVRQVPEIVFEVLNAAIRRKKFNEYHSIVIQLNSIYRTLSKKGVFSPKDVIFDHMADIALGYLSAGWRHVYFDISNDRTGKLVLMLKLYEPKRTPLYR
jgi:hypothetical protein